MSKEIALTLSGGGVRAVAHIGLIKALLENDITPTELTGTSGGALVSALYASGCSIDEMVAFFKATPIFDFKLYTLNKTGFIDSLKYQKFFSKYFDNNSFESLKHPVTITATNLLSGKLEYFNEGELIKPLIASCALPALFSPMKINDSLYCDGGVLNNFPVEPLVDKKLKNIIGSFVNPISEVDKSEVDNAFKVLNRVYLLCLEAENLKKFDLCNYVFEPKGINKIGIIDTKKIDEAFEMGYEEANKVMDDILKTLD